MGTEAPSAGPGQHAGCERRPTSERGSHRLTYQVRSQQSPVGSRAPEARRQSGRRAEPECGGAGAGPSRAEGPEVGPLRFLPAARSEGLAPVAAVRVCASSRAPRGPGRQRGAGLRVPEPDGERGARPDPGGGRSLPLRHPQPRRRAPVARGAGLGRGFAGFAASIPGPSRVWRWPLRGTRPLGRFLGFRRYGCTIYFCIWEEHLVFWLLGENWKTPKH